MVMRRLVNWARNRGLWNTVLVPSVDTHLHGRQRVVDLGISVLSSNRSCIPSLLRVAEDLDVDSS